MASQTYEAAMERVFEDEGGYSNDAGDPGGPTKYGITIYDVRKYVKANATAADVRALTKEEARLIYRKHYADPLRYDDLPAGLDYTTDDYGINSGIVRSANVLRHLVGLPSGPINDEVLAAVSRRDPRTLINAVYDERLRFLQSLRIWPTFGRGWTRRCTGGRAAALHWSGDAAASGHPPPPVPEANPGKGHVPDPKVVKNTVRVGVPGGGAAIGATWMDWFAAHPVVTAALVVVLIIGVAVALGAIEDWRKRKQETPMPVTPVPETLPPLTPEIKTAA